MFHTVTFFVSAAPMTTPEHFPDAPRPVDPVHENSHNSSAEKPHFADHKHNNVDPVLVGTDLNPKPRGMLISDNYYSLEKVNCGKHSGGPQNLVRKTSEHKHSVRDMEHVPQKPEPKHGSQPPPPPPEERHELVHKPEPKAGEPEHDARDVDVPQPNPKPSSQPPPLPEDPTHAHKPEPKVGEPKHNARDVPQKPEPKHGSQPQPPPPEEHHELAHKPEPKAGEPEHDARDVDVPQPNPKPSSQPPPLPEDPTHAHKPEPRAGEPKHHARDEYVPQEPKPKHGSQPPPPPEGTHEPPHKAGEQKDSARDVEHVPQESKPKPGDDQTPNHESDGKDTCSPETQASGRREPAYDDRDADTSEKHEPESTCGPARELPAA
jgi:hypothetical protein